MVRRSIDRLHLLFIRRLVHLFFFFIYCTHRFQREVLESFHWIYIQMHFLSLFFRSQNNLNLSFETLIFQIYVVIVCEAINELKRALADQQSYYAHLLL